MKTYNIELNKDPEDITGILSEFSQEYCITGGYARHCTGISSEPYTDIDIIALTENAEKYLYQLKIDCNIQILPNFFKPLGSPEKIALGQPLSIQSVIIYNNEIIFSETFMKDVLDKKIRFNFGMVGNNNIQKYANYANKYIDKGYHLSEKECMRLAVHASRCTHKTGNLPIGAIVLDDQGKIVGVGSNMINTVDPLSHAELNALHQAGRKSRTLITTLEPCPMCTSAASLMGVTKIIYGEKDRLINYGKKYPSISQKFSEECERLDLPKSIRKGIDGKERCNEFWDTTGSYPIPKESIYCPSCQSIDTIAHRFRFHTVPNSPTYYRCVVFYKCKMCSHSWPHGVVIPKEMFERWVPDYKKGEYITTERIHWRKVIDANN